jgi:nitrous oxidase accessory protein NosD
MTRRVKLESDLKAGLPCGFVLAIIVTFGAASAGVLTVGPDEKYTAPSQAIRAAAPGDTIRIMPGVYHDCAAWTKDNLTIEGVGEGVVLSQQICQGKGIFVIDAPNATIQNITFEGAETDEGNGSGIRAGGDHLTIDNCRFRNNQDGVLTANKPGATITVRNSTFDSNGACLPNMGCAHGIYVGHIALARIENSHFIASKTGHHIKSRAKRTEIVANTIEDGPEGTSSYLVDVPNGGEVLITGNTLEKGPNTQNPTAAISIGEEGGDRKGEIVITGNTFTNDGPHTIFVQNKTKSPVRLSGNVVKGPATKLTGPGLKD